MRDHVVQLTGDTAPLGRSSRSSMTYPFSSQLDAQLLELGGLPTRPTQQRARQCRPRHDHDRGDEHLAERVVARVVAVRAGQLDRIAGREQQPERDPSATPLKVRTDREAHHQDRQEHPQRRGCPRQQRAHQQPESAQRRHHQRLPGAHHQRPGHDDNSQLRGWMARQRILGRREDPIRDQDHSHGHVEPRHRQASNDCRRTALLGHAPTLRRHSHR